MNKARLASQKTMAYLAVDPTVNVIKQPYVYGQNLQQITDAKATNDVEPLS